MANNRTDGTVEVDATLDPSTVADLSRIIEKAITHGFELGFKNLGSSASGSEVLKVVNNIQAAMNKTAPAAAKAGAAVKGLQQNLSLSSREAYNLTKALQDIGAATKAIAASQYRARTIDRAAAITAREQISRDAQFRIETLKGENARAASAAQGAAQQQVVAARYAGKQRVLITQEALRTIGRLEKGLGVVISSTARTITSGLGSAFGGLTSIVRRNNHEFTNGLSTSLTKRESILSESFSRQERTVRNSVLRQERQLNELRTASSRGVLGAVSGRGVGIGIAGLAGGAGIAGLLTSGFTRFSDLERINKQFLALTGNVDDANRLLGEAKQFAKDTPFDLVGIADLAKGFLAIKTPVDQVLPRVKAIADAVALTGGGVEQLNGIQRAIGQIVSAGRLQGDELNQLAEQLPGLNIRQILADQLTGGDVPALIKLQEAGKLGADAVVNGLIAGLASDPRLSGASSDLAKTLSGRVANLKESFADFGAALIGTVAGPLKVAVSGTQVVLQSLADFIKGEGLGSALSIVRDGLKGAAIGLAALAAAKGGVETLRLVAVFAKLALTPMGALVVAAGLIGAAISILASRSKPLRDAFGALGDRLEEVGKKIADKLAPVIEAVQRFIDEKAIPALTRFADFLGRNLMGALDATISFITDTAVPAVVGFATTVADVLGRAWGFASDKAVAFFNVVKPYIQPAIDGFTSLGKALSGAFGGDFSGLRSGAANALGGIGSTIGNVAGAIGSALVPVAKKVGQFLSDLFSTPNLKKYASAFLGFVEEVGRILGTIVSSPLFLKVVAGIAAAAAIVALRFVEGFVKGVVSNVPALFGLIGEAFKAGLDLVFDNLGTALLGITALAVLGPRLVQLFRRFGAQAGGGFSTGLKSSMTLGSVKAFFGGPEGFVNLAKKNGQDAAKALAREFNHNNNLLAAAGQQTISKQGFFLPPAKVDESRAAVAKLKTTLGEAGSKALELRTHINETAGFLRGSLSAIRGFGSNFEHATETGARGFTRLKDAFKLTIADLRNEASKAGMTLGQALGEQAREGATIALAGIGGFIAGRVEGESGGSGVFSALTSGLAGLAEGGPLVGGVAAGASLLGTAFGAAGAAAKAARERVKALAASLKDELKQAIDDGTVSLSNLKNGLLSISDVAGLDSVAQTFKESLGGDGVQAMADFGVSFKTDLLPILKSGGDLDVMKIKLRETFLDAAASSEEFQSRFGDSSAEVKRMLAELLKPGGGANFTDLVGTLDTSNQELVNLLNSNKDFTVNIIDTAGDLNRAADDTTKALAAINREVKFFGTGADATPVLDEVTTVETRMSGLSAILTGIHNQFTNLFNPGDSSAQKALDDAVIAAASLGEQRTNATDAARPTVFAEVANIQRSIASVLSDALFTGIKEGLVVDAATAQSFAQPIIDAYVGGITDPTAAAEIRAQLEASVPEIVPQIKNVQVAQQSLDTLQTVGVQMGDIVVTAFGEHRPPEALKPTYNTDEVSAVGAEMAAVVNTAFGEVRPVEALGPTYNTGTIKSNARTAGTFVGDGFIEGIRSKVAAVAAAAARMAREATAAANRNFGISSPSKVFMEMGKFVGLGLAKGIEDTEETITSRITSMLDNVIETAKSAGSDAANAMRQIGVSLFGALVGPGASLNTAAPLNGATIAITNAFQGLLTSFDSQVQQVFAVGKKADEFARGVKDALPLTPAEQVILNENNAGLLFSFNASSVLGSGNLSALSSAFEAIAGLGEVMINQGSSANEVASALSQQVDALATLAASLGFSVQDVYSLADALGLSSDALASFVEQVNAVQSVASQSAQGIATAVNPTNENGPNTPPPQETTNPFSAPQAPSTGVSGPESQQAWVNGPVPPGMVVAFENNIYLPTGDPEAAALAVVNAQAQRLFV